MTSGPGTSPPAGPAAAGIPPAVSDPLAAILAPADRLKYYQEGRTDVRVYAGLLIQVVTLLLSTMIIIVGWVAKDYATQKYQVALRAAAPELASDNPLATPGSLPGQRIPLSLMPKDQANREVERLESELDYVSSVYQHILINSPTTSVILGSASFFTLVIVGMLIILTYQVQRRRYHYHPIGNALGLEPDQPVIDPVLTGKALNTFIAIVGVAAALIVLCTVGQSGWYIFHTRSLGIKAGVSFMLILVLVKAVSTSVMAYNYARFERREAWKSRWMRASVLVEAIIQVAKGHSEFTPKIETTLNELKLTCEQGSKVRWIDAKNALEELSRCFRETTLGGLVKEKFNDLVATLRHSSKVLLK